MLFEDIRILKQLGKQFIPDVTKPQVPGPFKGRPEISLEKVDEEALISLCPTGAISKSPVRIDMGKCVMCGECSFAFPNKIKFTTDYKIATNVRERLIIKEGDLNPITLDETKIRAEIRSLRSAPPSARSCRAGAPQGALRK